MASAPALAVTGSTGQLGLLVARLLAGAGSPLRLLVRDARRAPTLESAVPVVSSYDDPGLAAASLAGVKTLFMVSAAEAEDRLAQHCTFVDAAAGAAVARADVARSALTVLREPALHMGRTYDLTGPEDISVAQAAEILTAGTGRTVTFHHETVEEAYASRACYGAPRWQEDAWVSTYTAIAAGELAGPTSAVHELTGQEPLALAEFLAEAHHL